MVSKAWPLRKLKIRVIGSVVERVPDKNEVNGSIPLSPTMKVKVVKNPDRKITQEILLFQFQFMGWKPEDMEMQRDRWSSLPFGYVLGYVGSELIGTVNLIKRDIIFNGKKIILGGIGGVCVHKSHRKKGYSKALLKIAMSELKKEKCDIAFLDTELNNFYEKFGFCKLPSKYVAIGKSGKQYFDDSGMIAPVSSKSVFNFVFKSNLVFDLCGLDW